MRTLQRVQALHKPLIENISSIKLNCNLIDSTDVSSSGLGRRPDRSTMSSNDHISKLKPAGYIVSEMRQLMCRNFMFQSSPPKRKKKSTASFAYQTMRADGMASLKKPSASRKASVEKPVHASLHALDTLT